MKGELPRVTFHWDAETEILSARLAGAPRDRGFTGSIELEDLRGAVLTLDVERGITTGLEVVVWPETDTVEGLAPPAVEAQGRLVVPARPSQPGVGVVEIEVPLAGRRSPDESVIHLRVGAPRPARPVRLADGLIVETDDEGVPAGFWLVGVPPFPAEGLC